MGGHTLLPVIFSTTAVTAALAAAGAPAARTALVTPAVAAAAGAVVVQAKLTVSGTGFVTPMQVASSDSCAPSWQNLLDAVPVRQDLEVRFTADQTRQLGITFEPRFLQVSLLAS